MPIVSANVLTLRLTELVRSHVDPWTVDCSDQPGLGPVLIPDFQVQAAVTCGCSECSHLDPAIQGSYFVRGAHQITWIKALGRWLGIYMHPGPIWSTNCCGICCQESISSGHHPKGDWRQEGEACLWLELNGTRVWDAGRWHGVSLSESKKEGRPVGGDDIVEDGSKNQVLEDLEVGTRKGLR